MEDELMETNKDELKEEELRNFCRRTSSKFFEEYGLVDHQLNSYNEFIKHGLQKVFDSFGDLLVEPPFDPSKQGDADWRFALVRFGNVSVEKPTVWAGCSNSEIPMFPKHARLQNMTYSSRMKATVSLQVNTQKMMRNDKFKTGQSECLQKTLEEPQVSEILIGRIPVMVQSILCRLKEVEKRECEFDNGGYFIIKGAEKVFIAQEQLCLKRIWVLSEPEWAVGYKSEFKKNRVIIKLSEPSKPIIITSTTPNKNCLTVGFLSTQIPLWILFFALGASSDKEIYEMIDFKDDNSKAMNILFATIYDADDSCERFRNKTEALVFVSKQIQETKFPPTESLEECFEKFLFPFLRTTKQKAQYLAHMVKCLLCAYTGKRRCDNRDHFRNKRFELAGELLERELRAHVAHARRRMFKTLQRALRGAAEIKSPEQYFDASIITNGITRAFSTGAWAHAYKRNVRTSGVVANLGRTNNLQTLVDSRKTRVQVAYAGKITDARYPHPSHWGRVCFLSTPDGENCGLVKNLAATSVVTVDVSDTDTLMSRLVEYGMERLADDTYTRLNETEKVFSNGEWVGICRHAGALVAGLRRSRRAGGLHCQLEVKHDKQQKEIRIFSDAGRILRPLIIVENLHRDKDVLKEEFTFQYLVEQGIVELIGTEEEEDCCTAWGPAYLNDQPLKYTHCELDMSFLLGLSCGIIPFANHNHAKRVLYQAQKHSQQAIGFAATNPSLRTDTIFHRMYYPQRPLFRTASSDALGTSRCPSAPSRHELFNGQVAIVAVNVHLGYNQEDSLVMNRASLQRGMFRTEHVRSFKAEIDNPELSEKRRGHDVNLTFGKIQSKLGSVERLDDDGFPFLGAMMRSGDIIVGRHADTGTDHSVKLKHTEEGVVQRVMLSSNDEGKNFAVVSLRQVRSPCLGDKFSSMHGQKGVIGFLESPENFPFTRQGIVPDVVINPHAFPSRQTPGQLLESALGKIIACGSSVRYATPFTTPTVDAIAENLHSAGFTRWGNERVYNGRTGLMMKNMVFIGPTYYQRLTHMAEDKVKFRNTGPVHPVTRQPVSDRKRYGGVKFGEMERDCLIAHGASASLHERLFTLSDSSQMHVCTKCKNMANVIQRAVSGGRKIRGPYCRVCESGDDLVRVAVPYGAKLLYMELFSMGILLKFDTRLC